MHTLFAHLLPITNNCLRAGGLTQICGFCGGEDRFHAMVLFDTIDIPNTVVNARFLHRLVGYPDQDHDPNIDGTRPGGWGFLDDARPSITWPDERLNRYDWRVDEDLDMDVVQSIAERIGHPDWEARVHFLKMLRRGKYFHINRRTIEQIVQQEWIVAGVG